jgi:hypothetical protein
MSEEHVDILAKFLCVYRPAVVSCIQAKLCSLDDVLAFVDRESKEDDKYGQFPEGWVGYLDNHPVVKLKNARYLAIHGTVCANEPVRYRKGIASSLLLGTFDDIKQFVDSSQILSAYANRVKEKLASFRLSIQRAAEELAECSSYTKKEYALSVQRRLDPILHGFFYVCREELMSKPMEALSTFDAWLRRTGKNHIPNYERFVDSLKEE